MKEYTITWEERYKTTVKAKSKEEARLKFEGLTEKEMSDAYDEATYFEIEEGIK